MPTWRLLKREGDDEGESMPGDVWREIGTHESEHDYWIGPNAPKAIGSYHGPGEYLLLNGDRCAQLSIGARQEYFEILDEEPAELEPVSLKAAPSAAEIMDREG